MAARPGELLVLLEFGRSPSSFERCVAEPPGLSLRQLPTKAKILVPTDWSPAIEVAVCVHLSALQARHVVCAAHLEEDVLSVVSGGTKAGDHVKVVSRTTFVLVAASPDDARLRLLPWPTKLTPRPEPRAGWARRAAIAESEAAAREGCD